MATAEALGEGFARSFDSLDADPGFAERSATKRASARSWTAIQAAQTAVVGGLAAAVPGVHLLGAFVDVITVAHKMAVVTWGIGYQLRCPVDPRLDLVNVLALWSGAIPPNAVRTAAAAAAAGSAFTVPVVTPSADPVVSPAATGSAAAPAVSNSAAASAAGGSAPAPAVTGSAAAPAAGNSAALAAGGSAPAPAVTGSAAAPDGPGSTAAVDADGPRPPLGLAGSDGFPAVPTGEGATTVTGMAGANAVGMKLGGVRAGAPSVLPGDVVSRVGAKAGGKLRAKRILGWVPVVGSLVSAGINVWIMKSLADAARIYYTEKSRSVRARPAR